MTAADGIVKRLSRRRAGYQSRTFMTDDVETRRRRAAYRACHRGTKEMDWILGRYAQAVLAGMDVVRLGLFERMLALPDPDLQDMVMHPELRPAGEFAEFIAGIREFHGLEGKP